MRVKLLRVGWLSISQNLHVSQLRCTIANCDADSHSNSRLSSADPPRSTGPPVSAAEFFDDILYPVHYWGQALAEIERMLFRAFAVKGHRSFIPQIKSWASLEPFARKET